MLKYKFIQLIVTEKSNWRAKTDNFKNRDHRHIYDNFPQKKTPNLWGKLFF